MIAWKYIYYYANSYLQHIVLKTVIKIGKNTIYLDSLQIKTKNLTIYWRKFGLTIANAATLLLLFLREDLRSILQTSYLLGNIIF